MSFVTFLLTAGLSGLDLLSDDLGGLQVTHLSSLGGGGLDLFCSLYDVSLCTALFSL